MPSPDYPNISVQRPKRAQHGYPWIYSNELALTPFDKNLDPGALVHFVSPEGHFLGLGTLNRHALIAGRILSRNPEETPSSEWFKERFLAAQARREQIYPLPFYRWIHADADNLSGLVIDRYGDIAVVQVNTAGMERLESAWLPALRAADPTLEAIVVRYDSNSRQLEGLEDKPVVIHGTLSEQQIIGQEGPISFIADVLDGQKTGWFYDQRENRALVARWIKPGDRVLDLFTHTGSFALYAAQKGAIVDAVDRSAHALQLASKAALLNQLSQNITWHQAQVFPFLEQEQRTFDVVIVDPPAFVKSKASLKQGLQGYIKTITLALKTVKPGGLLCFTSCSHLITPTDMVDICLKAAQKSRRTLTLLAHLTAGFDHPVRADLPELAYLKGLLMIAS